MISRLRRFEGVGLDLAGHVRIVPWVTACSVGAGFHETVLCAQPT
jgi:hypothetical protein